MSVVSGEPLLTRNGASALRRRRVAVIRAVAALLWAAIFLADLHGRVVPTGSDIPLALGILLAAYPLIDAAAALIEHQNGLSRRGTYAACGIDILAVVVLLAATLALHTGSVLITFGLWAVASGVLQLAHAWRANTPRRIQLPLIVSGGISAIAGISFAALATQHTAHLANLGGYAILGALFFALSAFLDRLNSKRPL